jgi:hypothetical protein
MATFIDGIRQTTKDKLNRPDCVIVAGNRNLAKIWIAVGIQHRHQGDVEFASFENRI